MTKEVLSTFFNKDIAAILVHDMNLIISTTHALIQCHLKRSSPLPYKAIKAGFELLSLITDKQSDFAVYVFLGHLASQLGLECYEVFRQAALRGDRLKEYELTNLLYEVHDPAGELLLTKHAPQFAQLPIVNWLARLKTLHS